jgi:hypothetical protein
VSPAGVPHDDAPDDDGPAPLEEWCGPRMLEVVRLMRFMAQRPVTKAEADEFKEAVREGAEELAWVEAQDDEEDATWA